MGPVPACEAGFHLNFEPQDPVSQRLSHAVGWERTPANTVATAGSVLASSGYTGPQLRQNLMQKQFPATAWLMLKKPPTNLQKISQEPPHSCGLN